MIILITLKQNKNNCKAATVHFNFAYYYNEQGINRTVTVGAVSLDAKLLNACQWPKTIP